MAKYVPLEELARIFRSKNAGPYTTTFDIMFPNAATYALVVESGVLTPELIAQLYGIPVSYVKGIYFYEPALAVKISIMKTIPAGDLFCPDITGSQQHIPLLAIPVPIPNETGVTRA